MVASTFTISLAPFVLFTDENYWIPRSVGKAMTWQSEETNNDAKVGAELRESSETVLPRVGNRGSPYRFQA